MDKKEIVEETKPVTLAEKVEDIGNKLDRMITPKKKPQKLKPFKIPLRTRSQLRRFAKKSKIGVIILKSNRSMEIKTLKAVDGILTIDGVPRNYGEYYTYMYKRMPFIVIKEWALEPIGTADYDKKNPNGLPLASMVKLIYAYSKSNEVGAKKPMNTKAMVIFGLVVLVVLYILFGGTT